MREDYREGLADLSHTCRRLLERSDFLVPLEDPIWKRIRNHCKAQTLRIMEADTPTIALAPCDSPVAKRNYDENKANSNNSQYKKRNTIIDLYRSIIMYIFLFKLRYMCEPDLDATHAHGGRVGSRMALLVRADRCT